jgi:hypothetical protein
LAFRKIVSVKRDGKGFNIRTDATLGSRDVTYVSGSGGFEFLDSFNFTVVDMGAYDLIIAEKIFILWEE